MIKRFFFRNRVKANTRTLACVASVSVRFSARSRHFSFFSRAKIGAGAKKCVTGEGKGEKETLARKPHDFEKRPLTPSQLDEFIA